MLSKLLDLKDLKDLRARKEQQYQIEVDVPAILQKVEHFGISRGEQALAITEQEFVALCRRGKRAMLSQPTLLRLGCPIIIATGTSGHYHDLVGILSCRAPQDRNYLFLGDYVGRGPSSIQCLVLLLCNKLLHPDTFFMLRGCGDSIRATRCSRFYEECLDKFSPKAWAEACSFLCALPFAAVIENRIFCVHGGLSPQLAHLDQINKIPRPLETPQVGIPCDLIWSDPAMSQGALSWEKSPRGLGFSFSPSAAQQFLKRHSLQLICRAHEVVYDGFQYNKDKSVATICSLADYCGLFSNSAAVLSVDKQVNLLFEVIKQRQFYPTHASHDQSQERTAKEMNLDEQENRKEKELSQVNSGITMAVQQAEGKKLREKVESAQKNGDRELGPPLVEFIKSPESVEFDEGESDRWLMDGGDLQRVWASVVMCSPTQRQEKSGQDQEYQDKI